MRERARLPRLRFILAAAVWGATLLLVGCDGEGGSGTGPGRYLLEGYFGGTVVPGGFGMYVGRVESSDPSARDCEVTLNGSTVNPRPMLSTDSDAFFSLMSYDYEPNIEYTIEATLDGRSATCSFTGPEYPWVEISAPGDSSSFSPGDEIQVSWGYSDGTPERVFVRASASDEGEDSPLYERELGGATTSHTIPGSSTSSWGSFSDILITVDLGEEAWPFNGDLAYRGSFVVTVLSGDAIIIFPN